jgi:phospholipase D1/2
MDKGSHMINKAVNFLRTNVRGFWLEMPLEWGYAEGKTPEAPHGLSQAIAQNADKNEKIEVINA